LQTEDKNFYTDPIDVNDIKALGYSYVHQAHVRNTGKIPEGKGKREAREGPRKARIQPPLWPHKA